MIDFNNIEDNESVFDRLREYLDSTSESFRILEDEIDISLQMEYFEESKKIKDGMNENDEVGNNTDLFSPDTDLLHKKQILIKLASINKPEAFREIEKYNHTPDPELKSWAKLALHESRMLLESKLLDQNQIFISTGLGGKHDKLRYFFVLFPNDVLFSNLQKDIMQKEFHYTFEKNHSVIEDLVFHTHYATLMALIPIQSSVKDIFLNALSECNQFGDFINESFIVTNVKRLDEKEIMEINNQQKK